MKHALRSFAALALLFVPQTPENDVEAAKARLESALKATKLVYEPSASGLSFKLVYSHERDRKQTVYVSREKSRAGSLALHSVYTTVWLSGTEEPSEELLFRLLGTAKKLGAFYVHQDGKGSWSLRFGAQFDATDLPEASKEGDPLVVRLKDVIEFVNLVGEETDAAVNGERDVR